MPRLDPHRLSISDWKQRAQVCALPTGYATFATDWPHQLRVQDNARGRRRGPAREKGVYRAVLRHPPR